ncbi:MAG TPA: DNA-binding protein [Planctomycetes bacterium]|nr:DNA-binding protein [Planctomycetota bacterium]
MSDRMSFDQAAQELGLDADELYNLVSAGEINAKHDGDEITFGSDDVASFKRSRETEPTVVLSETQAEGLELEIDGSLDLEAMSTEETVLNIDGLLDDESGGGILEGGDDFGSDAVGDDTVLDTEGLDLDESFDLTDDDTVAATGLDELAVGSVSTPMQVVRKKPATAMSVMLMLTLLVMIGPAAILINLMASSGGHYPEWISGGFMTMLTPLVEAIVGAF